MSATFGGSGDGQKMSSTFGEDTFTREINQMDRDLNAMLSSRGTQDQPAAPAPSQSPAPASVPAPASPAPSRSAANFAASTFNPNDIERQVKGALQEAMGNTYKDGASSRYNIPNPREMAVSTYTPPSDPQRDTRVFGRDSNLSHPEPLPPNKVDLPRAANRPPTDEQAFPTPSLVRQEVYEPPSHIPGLNIRDKQTTSLERIGDALAGPSQTPGSPRSPRSQMIRQSLDVVRNAAASVSRANQPSPPQTSASPKPSLAPQSAALYDMPSTNIQRVTDNVLLSIPSPNKRSASIASRPGKDEQPLMNEILPDGESNRPPSRKMSRVNAYGEGYDDFISFAIKGKDPRFGFRYGMDPRLNPILCGVLVFAIVSLVIGIVLLALPDRTTVMFGFGVTFMVIASLFVVVSSLLTGCWRRVRF